MNFLLYLLFGFLPSLIWLCYYLQKDNHPEPRIMIIKIFIYGMLIGPLAALLQFIIAWIIHPSSIGQLFLNLNQRTIFGLINLAIVAPITEEFCKYLVVKKKVFNNPNFDEPVDSMVYFVVTALGFAAVENLLVFSALRNGPMTAMISNVALRFISATLIHVLASATLGYFLAVAFFETKKRTTYFIKGFGLAILFHASYNYLVYLAWEQTLNQSLIITILVLYLTFLSVLISWQFKELCKKIAICKTKG